MVQWEKAKKWTSKGAALAGRFRNAAALGVTSPQGDYRCPIKFQPDKLNLNLKIQQA